MTRAAAHTLALPLYRLATAGLALIAPAWLAHRCRNGKEDPARLAERYGHSKRTRPSGPLVWCHGASVGEALTLLALVEALTQRGQTVLLTTGTVSSAALMAERLPRGAFHQYLPLDHRPWVRRFLDHWRPDAVVWAESELWPNTLTEIADRKLPAYLVNGRLSDRALRGWRRWPGLSTRVLDAFTAILAQSPEDARRFSALGARDVRTSGNLKLAAAALPAAPEGAEALKSAFNSRPVWLAASIHPGEDEIAARVHTALKPTIPGLLTVVAPRHPPKAEAMAATFAGAGLQVARRSRHEPLSPAVDIYIADTLGELGVLYRACDMVVMGKSFTVGGGQNPAEPAKLGCVVICGPDMSNFRDLTAAMSAAGALTQVANVTSLTQTLARLLTNPAERAQLAARSLAFMAAAEDALAQTLAVLEPSLANPIDCP